MKQESVNLSNLSFLYLNYWKTYIKWLDVAFGKYTKVDREKVTKWNWLFISPFYLSKQKKTNDNIKYYWNSEATFSHKNDGFQLVDVTTIPLNNKNTRIKLNTQKMKEAHAWNSIRYLYINIYFPFIFVCTDESVVFDAKSVIYLINHNLIIVMSKINKSWPANFQWYVYLFLTT